MKKKKMNTATPEKPKPKAQDKPKAASTRTGVGKMFYLDPDLAAALDAFIEAQRIEPSQTAVFEVALRNFLRDEGYWPPPAKEE